VARLRLRYSEVRRRFTLTAGVHVSALGSPHVTAEFVVDTGTGRSALSHATAADLGVDIGRLRTVPTGGVTAIEERPVLPGVTLRLVGEDVVRVPLDYVLVLTDLRRKGKAGRGGAPVRRAAALSAPSLFGLDALARLRGRLDIDMAKEEGWIAWG